jgi:hypothetical protein
MIRMNPCHDTTNPPGQHVERPLSVAIEDYKQTENYKRGFNDGCCHTMLVLKQPESLLNSEYSR